MILRRLGLLLSVVGLFPFTSFASAKEPSVRYHLEYSVDVPAFNAETGKEIRLWVPYPANDPFQKVLHSEIRSPYPWRMETEKKFGNKILFIHSDNLKKAWRLEVVLDVERKTDQGFIGKVDESIEGWNPALHLGSTPWVPFYKTIREIAVKETAGSNSDFEKIKKLYNYVYRTMTYNKEGKGWGQGDPVWACTNRRGNCTDFHSLLIALAQTQKIPGRFEIGLPLPADTASGQIPGYHCWAKLYEEERGWIPLDVSESKKLGDPEAFFGRLPADRILFSVGRGLRLEPPQNGEPINFFFYPYAEIDGKAVETPKTRFIFKKLN